MPARSRALAAPTLLPRLWLALAALIFASLTIAAHADDKVVRIGYQKYGTLVLLKGRGSLEPKLKALGYRVQWSEFPSGPPLMEALNAGAVDFGSAGETPPIFAQAASDVLAYVAHEPAAPKGEAILVPKSSAVQSVADLRNAGAQWVDQPVQVEGQWISSRKPDDIPQFNEQILKTLQQEQGASAARS